MTKLEMNQHECACFIRANFPCGGENCKLPVRRLKAITQIYELDKLQTRYALNNKGKEFSVSLRPKMHPLPP